MENKVKYSIVVPAYNEEKSLRLFYDAVTPLMDSLQESYEMIFIDDGSADSTLEILRGLAEQDARVKVCSFPVTLGSKPRFYADLNTRRATR